MIKPLRDRIVVKPVERQKSAIIDVIMRENPNMGEVVAVGGGEYDKRGNLMPNPCKVGDRIRYGTTGEYLTYQEYEEDGEKYLIMSWKDVCWVDENGQNYQ
jgi:chaperonin GroES